MIELVLTINDKDGSYTEHAGVVLASIFSHTQQSINVHIVHDDSLSEENRQKLSQMVESFHHNIYFYHVTVPGDLHAVAVGVQKIDFWTIASMYRLLLPLMIPAEKVIYLDCDIFVNLDINELWSIDLGDRYLGAVLDQGENLLEYFTSLGLSAELYFNSGVILFHLNNIRNKQTWYEEMLHFLRTYPTMTMPDQDVLNAAYSSNYLQMEQRFNTFAHSELDVENKIVHFAGDNKWWDMNSPAFPLYNKFLGMTPWSREYIQEPVTEPEQYISPEPPAPEIQPAEVQHVEIQPPETQPAQIPALEMLPVTEVPVPEPVIIPVKRKRRRSLRLRKLRLRKLRLRRIRAKYRSAIRLKLVDLIRVKKKKTRLIRKKRKHAVKRVNYRKKSNIIKRKIKRPA